MRGAISLSLLTLVSMAYACGRDASITQPEFAPEKTPTMTTPSPVSDAESSAVLPDADADELPEPDEDGVFRYVVGGKISEPRLVKRGEIDSERFMGRQVTGASAVAEVTIDVDGTVRDVKLLHGLDREIDEAFLKAAREYVFEPATLDGEPVPVKYILVLRIQLM